MLFFVSHIDPRRPFYWYGLNLILAWISNHKHSKCEMKLLIQEINTKCNIVLFTFYIWFVYVYWPDHVIPMADNTWQYISEVVTCNVVVTRNNQWVFAIWRLTMARHAIHVMVSNRMALYQFPFIFIRILYIASEWNIDFRKRYQATHHSWSNTFNSVRWRFCLNSNIIKCVYRSNDSHLNHCFYSHWIYNT